MTEIIERVARALANRWFDNDKGWDDYPLDADLDGNSGPSPLELARAAIEAMHEPTEAIAFAMTTWQPIETAPRDGTQILLIDDENTYALASFEYGEWRDLGDIGAAGQYGFEPTHWMPLPTPPPDTQSVAAHKARSPTPAGETRD